MSTTPQAKVITLAYKPNIFDDAMKAYNKGDKKAFTSDFIMGYLEGRLEDEFIRRGDIIDIPHPYDNFMTIRYIWDGKKPIAYTTNIIDDDDRIPAEFKIITEFPIHYWDSLGLEGTCYGTEEINFDHTPWEHELVDNLHRITDKHNNVSFQTFITHKNMKYIIKIDRQSIECILGDKYNVEATAMCIIVDAFQSALKNDIAFGKIFLTQLPSQANKDDNVLYLRIRN